MAYVRINWKDLPSTDTPLIAENLNRMDEGIWNIENSKAISETILKNAGMFVEATNAKGNTEIGQRQTFVIGADIENNNRQYCNIEWRMQSGNGAGIVQTSSPKFFICDIYDQAYTNMSSAVAGIGYGYHARLYGQYAPGDIYQLRILDKSGNLFDVGDVDMNSTGTFAAKYNDPAYNNRASFMYIAQIFAPSP